MTNTPPTTAEAWGTLDELAAAVRTSDAERYRAVDAVAQDQELAEDQIRDAFDWGRNGGRRPFDRSTGRVRRHRRTRRPTSDR